MAKKTSRGRAGKRGPSRRKAGTGSRATVRGAKARRRKTPARPKARTKPAGSKVGTNPARRKAKGSRQEAKGRGGARPKPRGGTGREETLAQTPEAGRTVMGRTNPMPTRRSTGTPSGAGGTRMAPGLERARRQLREVEESVPTPPSSLDMNRTPSAARTGRHELREAREEHHETSPAMTGGDVDADWQDAYSVGDEAPGGDNPTPDQDRVDDIGKALGVEYQDNEELKAADKIAERDRKRWELDPASSEDYRERD